MTTAVVDDDVIFWKIGDARPPELTADPSFYSVVPKPTAWISVGKDRQLALLEGYNVASHAPPTLVLSSDALPPVLWEQLQETKLCSLSVATMREKHCLFKAACREDAAPCAWSFDDLGLEAAQKYPERPPAVQSSPIHMHCRLLDVVALPSSSSSSSGHEEQHMVLLEAETIEIRSEVLSCPTEQMLKNGRSVLAKIDSELLQPLASIGSGRFVTMERLHSMERPRRQSNNDTTTSTNTTTSETWESDPFAIVPKPQGPGPYNDITYTYHNDDSSLGYNPMKAVVVPRPIGWVSTYSSNTNHHRVSHVAPYSFFAEMGRHRRPMVAFSSYRKHPDNDSSKKDAQLDSETTKCFATNVVTKDLAVRMNYTSAPLHRNESEFVASPGLRQGTALFIDAPLVKESPIITECRYLTTVDVASYSIVVGEVVGIRIRKDILTADGKVDPGKLGPVTRLGYTDEYAIVDRLVSDMDSSKQ